MIMPLQNLYLYCHVRLPSITVSPCLGTMRNRYYSTVYISEVQHARHWVSEDRSHERRNPNLERLEATSCCVHNNFEISLLSHVKRSTFIYGKACPKWAWLAKKSATTLLLIPAENPVHDGKIYCKIVGYSEEHRNEIAKEA